MNKISNPLSIYLDARGGLIDGGRIYIGQANADPQTNPINVFWDAQLTIPAAQPLRTSGGLIVNNAQPAQVYVAEADYSMRLCDAQDAQIFYSPSIYATTTGYQPLDSDLTAIANQGTTAYGRGLLNLADQTALKNATGIPDPLPKAGGTVSGPIVRQGAGAYAYGATAALTGCRIFPPLPAGTANPASQPGDIQGFY